MEEEKSQASKWLERLLPLAIAVGGVAVTSDRNQAVLTNRLDNLISVVKENNERMTSISKRVEQLEKDSAVHEYRISELKEKYQGR